ncbi:MAG: thioredoxin-disulfide reductase [archaeon]
MENVIIIGGGISGLTAAIYTARANLEPILIEGMEPGGQLMLTTEVENYPGFPEGIKGPDLIANCRKQAERFGTRFISGAVGSITTKDDGGFSVKIGGKTHDAQSIIIATGASARWLGLESEKKYRGRGVSACATCDGAFYRGKTVTVIGGGDSAMEEALFLTRFAEKVIIIHRRDEFRASKIMQDRVLAHDKIEVIWNAGIEEVLGDDKVMTGLCLKDTKSSETREIKADGMFLAIGHIPNTKPFEGVVDLDDKGYLKSDEWMHTSVEGIFAAGDVHDFHFQQAVTAAGSGCKAAIEVEKYLLESGKQTRNR